MIAAYKEGIPGNGKPCWGYARWAYDPASDTFKPSAPLSLNGHDCGNACDTTVAKNDYIFTAYPKR